MTPAEKTLAAHKGPVTVMDAMCNLCAKGAKWIAHNDQKGEFLIVPLQSDLGGRLMRQHGMDPSAPSSWLYLVDGQAYSSADAFLRVAQRLGGIWKLSAIFRIIPYPILNWGYHLIARNRIRLLGRTDLCNLPDAEVQKRLLNS
ncbi:MAG: DUF393 domain-containing protein [Pseudomonadota bacterium]